MDVEITLDGKPVALRPTLKAARRVNALIGGFANAEKFARSGDIEYLIQLVALGLGKSPSDRLFPDDKMTVEEAVFRTGLPALGEGLSTYVNHLANGGKPFRPLKLKTVDGADCVAGKTYAEVADGKPVYVEDEPEPAGGETAGEA